MTTFTTEIKPGHENSTQQALEILAFPDRPWNAAVKFVVARVDETLSIGFTPVRSDSHHIHVFSTLETPQDWGGGLIGTPAGINFLKEAWGESKENIITHGTLAAEWGSSTLEEDTKQSKPISREDEILIAVITATEQAIKAHQS